MILFLPLALSLYSIYIQVGSLNSYLKHSTELPLVKMSYVLRTTSRLAARRTFVSRPFSTSSLRALKEGDQTSGEEKDKHIKDQLQKQKDGKGHWKPELASNSEEAVSSRPFFTSTQFDKVGPIGFEDVRLGSRGVPGVGTERGERG